jgi:outer membrane protein assembly factor BamA
MAGEFLAPRPALRIAVIIFLIFHALTARSDALFVIAGKITLSGNKLTRDYIILRELKFREGDTIPISKLPGVLDRAKDNVFNTRLFNFVTFDTAMNRSNSRMDLRIEVIERWYLWPIPYFQLSEQNINAWMKSWDLSKLTFGIDLTFFNVRGRNETLKMMLHFGFNQRYGFEYRIPYINRKQTLGLVFGAGIDLNRQVNCGTVDNQPVYLTGTDGYPKQLTWATAGLLIRPNIYVIHTLRVSWNHYYFQDTLLHLPGYALSFDNIQDYAGLYYQYKNDHRDIQFYPLRGWYFDAEFNHFIPYADAHNTYLRSLFRKYFQLANRWYYAFSVLGKLSFTKQQPFYFQKGLGYGNECVRGYELYVVDGQHYVLFRSNAKFAILPQRVEKIGFIRTSKFNTIPLALYANAFADLGYVYAYQQKITGTENALMPFNSLQNALMIGYGLGLDFTTYYDVVIRLEGSINLLGRPGIYLSFVAPI